MKRMLLNLVAIAISFTVSGQYSSEYKKYADMIDSYVSSKANWNKSQTKVRRDGSFILYKGKSIVQEHSDNKIYISSVVIDTVCVDTIINNVTVYYNLRENKCYNKGKAEYKIKALMYSYKRTMKIKTIWPIHINCTVNEYDESGLDKKEYIFIFDNDSIIDINKTGNVFGWYDYNGKFKGGRTSFTYNNIKYTPDYKTKFGYYNYEAYYKTQLIDSTISIISIDDTVYTSFTNEVNIEYNDTIIKDGIIKSEGTIDVYDAIIRYNKIDTSLNEYNISKLGSGIFFIRTKENTFKLIIE